MKGWRTLAFNAAVALAGVLVAFNWGDVLPGKYAILITSVAVPMINGWLRTITDTPVGKSG
jgi:hypothetical protein